MSIHEIPTILRQALDPDQFRAEGHEMVERLAQHLAGYATADPEELLAIDKTVLKWTDPGSASAIWDQVGEKCDLKTLADQTIAHSIHLHHPAFLGHQISPPLPAVAIVGLLVDLLSNGMGVFEMGIAGTAAEQNAIKLVARQFGMPDSAGGIMTSGGSLANLTAMLAARQIKSVRDVWSAGNGDQKFGVFVSQASHYCIERAVKIMGWGNQGLIRVPVDRNYRMKTESLESLLATALEQGITPIAVIGNACSTATGSFDDLTAIADFCQRNDLWFHVDGAHGGAVLFSSNYRPLAKGIERADSVTIDFHKMLLTPALASGLVFRNAKNAFRTFAQKADYLWDETDGEESPDLALRTFECTKQMMGLKVLALFKLYGHSIFEANIDRLIGLADHFADLVESRSHFELAVRPQCNIVCFRFRNDHADDASTDRLNESIRQRLLKQGKFYIVQTRLTDPVSQQTKFWLRTTISNPLTTPQVLSALLDQIEAIAKSEVF